MTRKLVTVFATFACLCWLSLTLYGLRGQEPKVKPIARHLELVQGMLVRKTVLESDVLQEPEGGKLTIHTTSYEIRIRLVGEDGRPTGAAKIYALDKDTPIRRSSRQALTDKLNTEKLAWKDLELGRVIVSSWPMPAT